MPKVISLEIPAMSPGKPNPRTAHTSQQRCWNSRVTDATGQLLDTNAPLAVKARCAYYILDQTKKAIETEEIEARVSELERAAMNENK